jgi:hypothetical protein
MARLTTDLRIVVARTRQDLLETPPRNTALGGCLLGRWTDLRDEVVVDRLWPG